MKLLLFSDLHRDHEAVEQLVTAASTADVVIGAGDFANCRLGLGSVIAGLARIDRPAVLVAGNNESADELRAACKAWPSAHVLHGSACELQGQIFFGLGGAVPTTPFGSWSFDLTEDEAADLLRDCPQGAVLVSHSPPLGFVDADRRGRHLGSQTVRDVVERTRLRLVVCGHIHASAGLTERIGTTPVVNAGPGGVWFEL